MYQYTRTDVSHLSTHPLTHPRSVDKTRVRGIDDGPTATLTIGFDDIKKKSSPSVRMIVLVVTTCFRQTFLEE